RWHASVDAVQAVGLLDEVRGRLRGAADAAHLGKHVGIDSQLVEGLDQVVGDRVVTTPSAQRGGCALVGVAREPDTVQRRCHIYAGTASNSNSGRVIASAGIGRPS